MEKTKSENTDTKRMGLSIQELKKKLGLDKIPIHKPVKVKKDGKCLYQVAGYFYPLRWETLERLKIPNQRILFEVDREEWLNKMKKVWNKQDEAPNEDER